ncbi:NAD-dependent succinate-semialdehyde dehydrogenase [Marispirochaeta aestuarii]|uniref:NAD-dependent succinate-semialdehyde dehydrogenase n=1 Tax=Marispirochaeta aestuarii TaxID=1963862 RepID=UPI0029C89FAD|nr:NAD-dependent succinate-semialdehyde dehydrogenase [Marispirochaeta aestuarii]
MAIRSVNPSTGRLIKEFTPLTEQEIEIKLSQAADCFREYRRFSFEERAGLMFKAADLLETRRDDYAGLISAEMGKTIRDSRAEVEKSAWVCRYYADNAAAFMADEMVATEAKQSFVRYQPIGPVLAVMPWNYPFWQVFRFAAPALMAGNVGLLKHASNVPQSALEIERIFLQAGFPEGAFQTLLVPAGRIADLTADPRIKAATLTGSEAAGASLAANCGGNLKKTVLELGGSDPYIVLPDADMEKAVATATRARLVNNGQACIAAKRFILHHEIADDFLNRLIAEYGKIRVGDPADESTDLGPLVSSQALEEIRDQVAQCVAQGGTIAFGGNPEDLETYKDPDLSGGYYYPPTIITGLTQDAPISKQEIFGPVAMVFRARDLDEAIEIANATEFGLGASAWTGNPENAERLINEIEAGNVFINSMVKSDPRLPFGGIKTSGYGRELSALGLREFTNIKTVWVD